MTRGNKFELIGIAGAFALVILTVHVGLKMLFHLLL